MTSRAPSPPAPLPRRHWYLHIFDSARISIYSPSPRCGGGSGWGGERRLTLPPPSQPSPIEGEGVKFFDCSLRFRDLCRYRCAAGRGGKEDERVDGPQVSSLAQCPPSSRIRPVSVSQILWTIEFVASRDVRRGRFACGRRAFFEPVQDRDT